MAKRSEAGFNAEAIDLLLVILESPDPMLSGAAAEILPGFPELRDAGLLAPAGHEAVHAARSAHNEEPVELRWSEAHGGFGRFGSAGWISVPPERLNRFRTDMRAFLPAISN
jgi:hypothetical protein